MSMLSKLQRCDRLPKKSFFRILVKLRGYPEPLLRVSILPLVQEYSSDVECTPKVPSINPYSLLIKIKCLVSLIGDIELRLDPELVLLLKLLVQILIGGPSSLHLVPLAHPVLSALERILRYSLAVRHPRL